MNGAGRDWGDAPVRAAPLDTLLSSLTVRRAQGRYRRFTLTELGRGRWEARTYCGCDVGDDGCRCASGHGDSPSEAIAALLQDLT